MCLPSMSCPFFCPLCAPDIFPALSSLLLSSIFAFTGNRSIDAGQDEMVTLYASNSPYADERRYEEACSYISSQLEVSLASESCILTMSSKRFRTAPTTPVGLSGGVLSWSQISTQLAACQSQTSSENREERYLLAWRESPKTWKTCLQRSKRRFDLRVC